MQDRRRFLQGMAAATSVGVAGCSLGDGGDGTPVEATFVDDCNDTGELAESSDFDNLGTDTTNTENFEHPDGSRDSARLNRVDATDDAALVYAPDWDLLDARAEFHWHEEAGGDLRVEESTDSGDSWSAASVERTGYGGVDNAWLHADVAVDFSGGVDRVRFVLTQNDATLYTRPAQPAGMADVIIEYCVPCGFRERAVELQEAILTSLERDLDSCTLLMGDHGVFTVSVDGETVYDKDEDNYDTDEIVRTVREHL
jgi:selenoprotein W-related protein